MPLINKIQESGWSDTTSDDWFFHADVKRAVTSLKNKLPQFIKEIDDVFGDMDQDYETVNDMDIGDEA